jgi:hypothetical protein
MHIIIVHGEKPLRSGMIHPELIFRLEKALDLTKSESIDLIVITGGQTRKMCASEAAMGYAFIKRQTNIPVLLEEKSHTTAENIMFTKALLKEKNIGPIDKLIAISGKKRMRREKYLYRRLWKELFPKITFVPAKDLHPFPYYLAELLYFIFALIDPRGKTVTHITEKIFRNA